MGVGVGVGGERGLATSGLLWKPRRVITGYYVNSDLLLIVPGTPPTITTFNVSSPYFALVEWNPPSIPNGQITHYNLYVDYENGTNDTLIVEGQFVTCNITDILPYQYVSVEMSANTSVGEGPRCPRVMDQTAQSCKQDVYVCSLSQLYLQPILAAFTPLINI